MKLILILIAEFALTGSSAHADETTVATTVTFYQHKLEEARSKYMDVSTSIDTVEASRAQAEVLIKGLRQSLPGATPKEARNITRTMEQEERFIASANEVLRHLVAERDVLLRNMAGLQDLLDHTPNLNP